MLYNISYLVCAVWEKIHKLDWKDALQRFSGLGLIVGETFDFAISCFMFFVVVVVVVYF